MHNFFSHAYVTIVMAGCDYSEFGIDEKSCVGVSISLALLQPLLCNQLIGALVP